MGMKDYKRPDIYKDMVIVSKKSVSSVMEEIKGNVIDVLESVWLNDVDVISEGDGWNIFDVLFSEIIDTETLESDHNKFKGDIEDIMSNGKAIDVIEKFIAGCIYRCYCPSLIDAPDEDFTKGTNLESDFKEIFPSRDGIQETSSYFLKKIKEDQELAKGFRLFVIPLMHKIQENFKQ